MGEAVFPWFYQKRGERQGIVLSHNVAIIRDNYILFNSAVSVSSTRVNGLVSESKKKNSNELVIEQSMELYGYTPAEKSDENEKWMLQNGYFGKKKMKRGTRGRHAR